MVDFLQVCFYEEAGGKRHVKGEGGTALMWGRIRLRARLLQDSDRLGENRRQRGEVFGAEQGETGERLV